MFPKELTFNTGRGYGPDGQSITAVFVPDHIDDNGDQVGAIEFVDVTRGIDGRFENVAFTNREIFDGTFQARVIDLYDRGGYDSTQVIKLGFRKPSNKAGNYYEVDRYETKAVDVPANGHTFWGGNISGIVNAIDEAIIGDHVAHVRNLDTGRVVAIRPRQVETPDYTFKVEFELTFSDPKVDLRNGDDTITTRNVKNATRLIANFLVGIRVCKSVDYFQDHVNQKDRDCEIIRLTKTRARIRYWLPNSGDTEAWRAYTQVGSYLYLRAC